MGVRWSELLRLPYFDPSRFVVVDAMHNLFLGLIHEHFTGILGLHLPTDKDKDPPVLQLRISDTWKQLSKNEISSMRHVLSWLERPMVMSLGTDDGKMHWFKKLSNKRLSILELLCIKLGLQPKPVDSRKVHNFHQADYARSILEWVSGNNFCLALFLRTLSALCSDGTRCGPFRALRNSNKMRICSYKGRSSGNP
jgi:hypothetical protein